MLTSHTDVRVVGDACSGRTALVAIRDLEPDLVFLDIQMPGLDGFRVVDALGPGARPLIVFVTAHDHHAVEAFGVRALDYLLKPVADVRLAATMERVRSALHARAQERLHHKLRALMADDSLAFGMSSALFSESITAVEDGAPYAERLAVRVGNRSLLVPVDDIDWLEADGFCSIIHAGARRLLIRETLLSVATRLNPSRFIRVHRSSIVNLERVVELRHPSFQELTVVLRDGTELAVSRRRRDEVMALIGPSR